MKKILAIVGMPGSGKSQVALFFKEKGVEVFRFGDITDQGLREEGLDFSEHNERYIREKIRRELGMAAYAIKSEPQIRELLKDKELVVLDGLYSWEEYKYLREKFANLYLVCVFAEPPIRYERLAERSNRPVALEEARGRDVAEIENLNKGGPIAIADYFIDNNTTLENLKCQLDKLFQRLP